MVTRSTHHALPVGAMIEEFRIVRVLGAGSFGIVYQCENTYLPETAAIKEFLPPELACRMSDDQVVPLSAQTEESFNWARDKFLEEAKTLWELSRPERHPNIVRVTRYCEANGTAYMFMEFEQGRPLSAILEAQTRLTPQELEGLFYPLLDGLERVHEAGVVHRDIKPANILIRADGSPVLIDFGAARHLTAGGERSIVSAYTPVYAALEQYLDFGEQGPWTDIYSLGATLYQAVTGRKPLNASERLCGGVQTPATEECGGRYPRPVLLAIDRALAVKPEERPRSVAEWRRSMSDAAAASGAYYEPTVVRPTVGPNEPTRVVTSPRGGETAPSGQAAAPEVGSPKVAAPEVGAKEGAVSGPGFGKAALVAVILILLLAVASVGLYYRDALFASLRGPQIAERADRVPEGAGEELSVVDDRVAGEAAPEVPSREEEPGTIPDAAQVRIDRGKADAVVSPGAGEEETAVGEEVPAADGSSRGVQTEETLARVDDSVLDGLDAREQARIELQPDKVPIEAGEIAKIDAPTGTELPGERDRVFPGTRFSDPLASGGSGPVMVWVPGGDFKMGSPMEEAGRNPDERLHDARVPQPYAVSETEITLGQFRRFVEATGYRTEVDRTSTCLRPDEDWQELVSDMSLSWASPGYEVSDRHPVTCISWNDARAYAEWLTEQTGRRYRLPTELEWEYAARASTQTSRFWGDELETGCNLANTAECEDGHTYSAPAGVFPPNPFGLRDMLGNLAEWTCSEYGKGYNGIEARCSEGPGRSPRVFRGGSWLDAPELVRSAARDGAPADLGLNTVGFRLVRTLPSREQEDRAVTDEVAERP